MDTAEKPCLLTTHSFHYHHHEKCFLNGLLRILTHQWRLVLLFSYLHVLFLAQNNKNKVGEWLVFYPPTQLLLFLFDLNVFFAPTKGQVPLSQQDGRVTFQFTRWWLKFGNERENWSLTKTRGLLDPWALFHSCIGGYFYGISSSAHTVPDDWENGYDVITMAVMFSWLFYHELVLKNVRSPVWMLTC